jgi:hypothetical protein
VFVVFIAYGLLRFVLGLSHIPHAIPIPVIGVAAFFAIKRTAPPFTARIAVGAIA